MSSRHVILVGAIAAFGCHYDLGSPRAGSDGGAGSSGMAGSTMTGGGAGGRIGSSGGSGGRGAGTSSGGTTAMAGSGAGGGAAGHGGVVPVPVAQVTSSSPMPNAAGIDTRAAIELTLDRPATAGDATHVTVEASTGQAVDVTVEVTGNTLRLVPRAPLDMEAVHRVTLSAPLTRSPSSWTFTTADGAFRSIQDLFYAGENPEQNSRVIAADAAVRGHLTVVAYRTVEKVLLRRSLDDGGPEPSSVADAAAHAPVSWLAEEPVADAGSDGQGASDTAAVVDSGIDGDGNVIVVWNAPTGASGAFSIFASRWSATKRLWAPAVRLEQDTDSCTIADGSFCGAAKPVLAVSSSGNAVVTWERRVKSGTTSIPTVWATTWDGTAWRSAQAVSTSGGSGPGAAVDDRGNCLVIWSQSVSASSSAVKLRRVVSDSSVWEAERTLKTAAGAMSDAFVRTNGAGNVLAGWTEWPMGFGSPNTGKTAAFWETPNAPPAMATAGPGGDVNGGYGAALGETSAIIAAWGATNPNSVSAAAYLPGKDATWPGAKTVSTVEDYVTAVSPVVDDAGRGLVAWVTGPNKTEVGVHVARYDKSVAKPWSSPLLESAVESVGPNLAMDRSGKAVLAWIHPENGALEAVFFD